MTESEIRDAVREAAKLAKASNPLTPSITNTVTINFVANAQLAVGGSAAMVYLPDEGVSMAKAGASMYINVGTLSRFMRKHCQKQQPYSMKKANPGSWIPWPLAWGKCGRNF